MLKVNLDDVVIRNSTIEKVALEKVKEKKAFPATPNPGENLDEAIVFRRDHAVQKFISLDNHKQPTCENFLAFAKKMSIVYQKGPNLARGYNEIFMGSAKKISCQSNWESIMGERTAA